MSTTTGSLQIPQRGRSWAGYAAQVPLVGVARFASIAVSVFALFLLAGAFGLGLYGSTHVGRVYQGVLVAGIDVGGMTESEARTAVEQRYGGYLAQPVSLSYKGTNFRLVPKDAGVAVDVDETVDAAMAYGRSGSLWSRTQRWAGAFLYGADVPVTLSVDQARLDRAIGRFAPKVVKPPVDASVRVATSGSPEIVAEQAGVAFDLGATEQVLLSHLAGLGQGVVPVVAPSIPPAVTAADLGPELSAAQSAVSSALMLTGVGQYWSVSQADLKRIVTVPGPGEPIEVDRRAVEDLVRGIAKQIERPAVDAQLVVDDQGELRVVPSDRSVAVDVNASIDAIVQSVTAGTHDVPLVIARAAPAISDAQAQTALAKTDGLVKNGLALTWNDQTYRLGPADLIAALTIDHRPGEAEPIVVGFSPEVVQQLLGPIAEQIDVEVQNGRYRYVDGKVKLVEKGANGRTLDLVASTDAVIGAVTGGKSSAPLSVQTLKPALGGSDVKKIKLDDVLASAATYYGNSSDARRKNVERAVQLESGWLVAPGDVFSFYQNVGQVTEKNGFVTGLGILSDGAGGITTAPVVGGGICQVSTTIFQSAFWAGLSIVERTQHPYWLQSYGQPPSGMLGLDAMVNIEDEPAASLDLKFRNNTGNWIAVVITADGENVTSQILGTNPGWNVAVENGQPTLTNYVDPPQEIVYQDSPELAVGEERQVESAQQGFDSIIRRITTDKDGNVIDDYTMTSTYVPSVNRILRGTGGDS